MAEVESKSTTAAPSGPSLEIRLLGPFRVSVNGETVDEQRWKRRKPISILKILALQPHHQLHREQLMEFLWPDLHIEAAANNLNKSIHAARRALEPALRSGAGSSFILTRGHQIHLRAPGSLWIDAEAFEAAATEALKSSDPSLYDRALDLYEGDLLIEDPYEEWTRTPRERLLSLRQELLENVAKLHEAEANYTAAVERVKLIVAADPANEEAHRSLMRLYALSGNRQLAIHQYHQCCQDLRRELDESPDQETVNLHARIAAGTIQPSAKTKSAAVSAQARPIVSIAVLPLVNAGTDASAEYVSDGITEGIINSLSQLTGLRVMAWSSVSRYKDKLTDAKEVGRELGVRSVLTGRVLQATDYVVVKTELVDATDGSQLWGEQYKLKAEDAFAVEGEISRDISEKLRLKLTGADRRRLTRRYTTNTEAYHAYLKGRYCWNKRTPEWLWKGVDHFRRAIELDPGYALAYVGLSDSYTLLCVREELPPADGFARAKAAAIKALEIDDELGEAHASLGHAMLHNWEWDDSAQELKRAIEINPGYPSGHHWYSEYLTAQGIFVEAIDAARRAEELDPLSLIITSNVGDMLYFARRYDEAIEQCQRLLALDSEFWLIHLVIGKSKIKLGLCDEAIEDLRKASTGLDDDTEVAAVIGFAHAAAGRRSEALKTLERLTEKAATS